MQRDKLGHAFHTEVEIVISLYNVRLKSNGEGGGRYFGKKCLTRIRGLT